MKQKASSYLVSERPVSAYEEGNVDGLVLQLVVSFESYSQRFDSEWWGIPGEEWTDLTIEQKSHSWPSL